MRAVNKSLQQRRDAAHAGARLSPTAAALTLMTLLLVSFPFAGCATTQHVNHGNGAQFEVITEQAPDADAEVKSQVLEPTRATVERWAAIGDSEPFEIRMSVTGSAENERWTRSEPSTTRVFARTSTGDVILIEQTDASDGATTRFIPPLLLAPPLLRAGRECTGTSVVQTIRGDAVDNDGGRAQRTVKLASKDRIRTPLGEFNALRFDAVFTMKVPFASMRRETSTWVRPGDGPVAIRSVEKILVMGVVPRNRSETRVRLPATGFTP